MIDPANLLRPGDVRRLQEILDEAFDWLGPDIVLAHAKEPIVDETGKTGLNEMKDRAQRTKDSLRSLIESGAGRRVDSLRDYMTNYLGSDLFEEHLFISITPISTR